jgi:hypothetical protein
MNLYLLSQDENKGWDTYDSVVVAAENEEEARKICPAGMYEWDNGWYYGHTKNRTYSSRSDWANDIANISVKLIGVADPTVSRRIIISSFNAG